MNKLKVISLFMSSFIMANVISAPSLVKATTNINKLQEEKKQIIEEKKIQKSKLDQIKEAMDAKTKELHNAQAKVDEFERKINTLHKEITETDSEINKLQNSILENTKAISDAEEEKKLKEEILGERLRNIYKSNMGDKFLYILLESKNFGDLLSNIANIKMLVKTDNELISEVEALQKELEDRQSQLESSKSTLDTKKIELVEKQGKLEKIKLEHEATLNLYKSQLDELEALEANKNAELKDLASKEDEIEKEIQSYFDNNSSSNSGNSDDYTTPSDNLSTGFIRPVSSNTITSNYGPRIHPITGEYKVHTGVDFAASAGDQFFASKDGVVTTASYHPAYGNMVIIDHGGGISTLYAHASELKVSVGQHVKQGQVISLVGSTGYSTGPHAHFEVRVNGQHVNPMNYIV